MAQARDHASLFAEAERRFSVNQAPPRSLLQSLIDETTSAADAKRAVRAFALFSRHHLPALPRAISDDLVEACAKAQYAETLLPLLKKRMFVFPTEPSLHRLQLSLEEAGDWESLRKVFTFRRDAGLLTMTRAIDSCLKGDLVVGAYARAQRLLNARRSYAALYDAPLFTRFFRALGDADDAPVRLPKEAWLQLMAANVTPDVECATMAIRAAVRRGSDEEVVDLIVAGASERGVDRTALVDAVKEFGRRATGDAQIAPSLEMDEEAQQSGADPAEPEAAARGPEEGPPTLR